MLFFKFIFRKDIVKTVTVGLAERSYKIYIENGLLDSAGKFLSGLSLNRNCAIITNDTVAPLYLNRVKSSLRSAGFNAREIILPDGETHKTLNTISFVYDQLIQMDFDRNCSIIALGGGVIGDMAGFAAATFFRGVPYIQIPTTLLSQVDSSVGGKTGVNLTGGKNLVGAFYQPKMVIIDPDVLSTLDLKELRAGLAEVIKYGVILDETFFDFLVKNILKALALDHDTLVHIIQTCCSIKADVTAQDETEKGIRSFLNFGHTIGHAIEALTGYQKYVHGEAVAMGMAAVSRLSVFWGLCSQAESDHLIALLEKTALPVDLPEFSLSDYIDVMLKDKKRDAGGVKMVLMKRIGKVCTELKTADQLTAALKESIGMV